MPNAPGPMARRRQLGTALRSYRTDAGLSVREVADQLLCSPAKISRIETAQRNISLRDVRDLCDLYRLDPESRDQLMRMAQESRESAWWDSFNLSPELEKFVGLEVSATEIKDYQIVFIPGLLQTRGYATAVLRLYIDDPDALAKAVDVRMTRQDVVLKRTDLHAVIDESVVRRMVGNEQVMRDQIDKLINECESSSIRLQVVPFSAGATKGLHGFIALHFAPDPASTSTPGMSDIVYYEGLNSLGSYLERQDDVNVYLDAFNEIESIALSERDTLDFLKSVNPSQT